MTSKDDAAFQQPSTENPFHGYLTKRQFCESVPGGPISERTADRWHIHRIGPPRVKFGIRVLYPVEGVRRWLESQTTETLRGAR